MTNNNTSSNDCLYDCKEQMRECVSSSNLNIDCEQAISALTREIDIEKFKAWLERNKSYIQTKQNIQSYFNRAFLKELEKGTFDVKLVSWNSTTLFNAMRGKGINVIQDDTCYITLMWNYYVKAGVKIDLIQELNHKIVDFMKEGQTTQDYINLVKKSKALQDYKVDWKKLQEDYEIEIADWHRILANLSMEVIPSE